MYKDKTAILFIFTAFVAGLCGAFFYPLSSLFIVEELGATPMMLSLYMVLAVMSSVAVSQFLASQSDKNWPRKAILVTALISYFITVVSFIFVREYWVGVAIATMFGSISGAAFGQLFAMGREYADENVEDSTTFLSTMRAGMAIAWVFGPPAAFIIKASFGFGTAFAVSALIVSIAIGVILRYLPDCKKSVEQTEHNSRKPLSATKVGLIALYCFAMALAFAANNLYITSMPLYLSQELQVDSNWLGFLFGAGALCEIPVMLWAGRLSDKVGTIKLLVMGIVSGALFYVVMLTNTSFVAMLCAQLLNGFFIGVCATLGMVVLQDMMRDRLGTASTLFTNLLNVSALIASLSLGVVGELYNYYSTLYVSLFGSLAAIVLLVLFNLRLRHTGETLKPAKA
ncbi:MFS transporter [Vibrio galatheae]|uniref:MFS transporter n=1 Tax=Vibrio galatheae TaxID=579748 RepID=A0A0F4NJ72_9VIBR|nr:sugar efflux transporter [Vibrio galatheae]KJY82954.1 MFS transporter [Vibrio galatheae]